METDHLEAPEFSAKTRRKNLVKMRMPQGVEEFEVVKTNCFECHSKCGLFSYIKDGKLIKVEGNPDEPRSQGLLCSKGLAAPQMLYSPDRINYPMKRTNPKGADDPGWVRISWDEALDTIVNNILENREKYGPHSVVTGQGTGRGTNQWNQRLGVAIGQNHWLCPAHVCLLPIMLTSMLTTGFFAMWDSPDMVNSKCYVSWGSNAAWTSLGYSGAGIRTILEKQARGEAKIIQVDPRYEAPLSSKADVWLPIRPGSDAAMAMSWIHVIISEKLYQEDFVKKWTNGPFLVRDDNGALLAEADAKSGGAPDKFMVWDTKSAKATQADEEGIDPALLGSYTVNGIACKPAFQILADNAAEVPPEKAEEICWCPKDRIYEAARMYAENSPGSSMNAMQGVEEAANNNNTIHALLILMMLTGNLDVKGGNIWYVFWNEMLGPRLVGEPPPTQEDYRLGKEQGVMLYPVSQPKAAWEAMITGKPYPIKTYINIAGNPLSWSENTKLTRKALESVEFLVTMDYFMSPTAHLSDIVLPSAHWTERDYIADELCMRWEMAQVKSVEPLFERMSDITFFRTVGHRVNPEVWPWETDEALFDFQLEPVNITWEQLKEQYIVETAPETYEKFKDPKWGLNTPTRRFEIYGSVFGQVGANPIPEHQEVPMSPFSRPDLVEAYPLVLATGNRMPNFYHSGMRNIPWARATKPYPEFQINPEAAKKYGIKNRQWCWIETPNGKCKQRAHVSLGVDPRVVLAEHGWWQDCKELKLDGYENDSANINCCVGSEDFGKVIGTPTMRGILCKVYPAEEEV